MALFAEIVHTHEFYVNYQMLAASHRTQTSSRSSDMSSCIQSLARLDVCHPNFPPLHKCRPASSLLVSLGVLWMSNSMSESQPFNSIRSILVMTPAGSIPTTTVSTLLLKSLYSKTTPRIEPMPSHVPVRRKTPANAFEENTPPPFLYSIAHE